ncbi:ABC transporter substrate-binding protein [Actinomadura rugatobispora]|uniref:ABC transporter substrate-binding protein n=1 Tax=Actinomadura rugatobispora TaxID=1994 RepID=A0ABW1A362_9ACTN
MAGFWTISKDGRSYTFTLRENVRFSDGTPLDAAALKLNFDRIMDKASPLYDKTAGGNMITRNPLSLSHGGSALPARPEGPAGRPTDVSAEMRRERAEREGDPPQRVRDRRRRSRDRLRSGGRAMSFGGWGVSALVDVSRVRGARRCGSP